MAWEYVYFLDDIRDQTISNAALNEAAGYEPGARVYGFNVLDQAKSDRILGAFDLGSTTTTMAWDLKPGDKIQRKALHERFGGAFARWNWAVPAESQRPVVHGS